ncbi:hypothetical protein DFH09DRAFT_1103745 [Mycena vulgaris]|nr:hypothetical protein DFH09DRAFT_1103745 [Mycena vulgaris]
MRALRPYHTEELERMVQYAISHPEVFPEMFPDDRNNEDEDEAEEEHGAESEGDTGIHGLEYSDDEESDDEPEGPHGRATDDLESDSQDDEGESDPESEEEEETDVEAEVEYSTTDEQMPTARETRCISFWDSYTRQWLKESRLQEDCA